MQMVGEDWLKSDKQEDDRDGWEGSIVQFFPNINGHEHEISRRIYQQARKRRKLILLNKRSKQRHTSTSHQTTLTTEDMAGPPRRYQPQAQQRTLHENNPALFAAFVFGMISIPTF